MLLSFDSLREMKFILFFVQKMSLLLCVHISTVEQIKINKTLENKNC